MNVTEVLAAWQDAQACETHDFYTRFFHLTGLDEQTVKRRFGEWNRLSQETTTEIAHLHGVGLQTAGFQAYLVEVFWSPRDERAQLIRHIARYLRMVDDGGDAAAAVDNILDCELRLGRPPIPFALAETGPSGSGDPREHKDWPESEDCPGCPSGRKGGGHHKMSCTTFDRQLKLPARMGEDGKLHLDILTPKV